MYRQEWRFGVDRVHKLEVVISQHHLYVKILEIRMINEEEYFDSMDNAKML